jgi:FkbM family methyltransferase
MLISFDKLKKYGLKITGFIQAGAHYGEELEDFRKMLAPENADNIYLFEPLPSAVEILKSRMINGELCYQCALGAKGDTLEMHVDIKNEGQSSSLLKPALHLQQYPDITFPKVETVQVITLDSFDTPKVCNALWMDVQGYELEVLKGAVETLKHIDYVYTEVNVDEVYENCARLYEIDEFLTGYGFTRVELDLYGQTWGDAFYIKNRLLPERKISIVPIEFQQKIKLFYPPDNETIFEEWLYEHFSDSKSVSFNGYTYLPIFWTGFYCNNEFGQNNKANEGLQHFIDSLSNKIRYFTVLQYDDGAMVNFRDKKTVIFNMGGRSGATGNVVNIPIPLLGTPHKFDYTGIKKDIICSFIGRLETHPVRKKMQDYLERKPDFFISNLHHPLDQYCMIVARSFFTLAPRGYGKTSFRIWEAFQYESVPVYVTEDDPYLPAFYDHEKKPAILICKPQDVQASVFRLFNNRPLYRLYVENGKFYFRNYYNYPGLKNYIIETLVNL